MSEDSLEPNPGRDPAGTFWAIAYAIAFVVTLVSFVGYCWWRAHRGLG